MRVLESIGFPSVPLRTGAKRAVRGSSEVVEFAPRPASSLVLRYPTNALLAMEHLAAVPGELPLLARTAMEPPERRIFDSKSGIQFIRVKR